MMDSGEDAIVALGLILIGVGLIIIGLVLWAIVSFIIAAIVAYNRQQRYLREAEEDFDEVVRELGVDLPIEEVLESIGLDVPPTGEFETVADWMAGTPVGVTTEWDN
jgi:hypothetical protein